jgi:alkylation response protein AidB-like acyl-CoA dehydrogenase
MEFSFTDEQKAFKDQVLKFSQKELAPLAEEADWKAEFCWEAWRKMGDFGLLGITYPEAYGGSGADVVTACLAGEAVAKGGAEGACLAWGAYTYLCGDTIIRHGTEDQRKYAPNSPPENGWGHGLTDRAGSDAASVRTTAVRKGFLLSEWDQDVHYQWPDRRRDGDHRGYGQGKKGSRDLGFHRGEELSRFFRRPRAEKDGGKGVHHR